MVIAYAGGDDDRGLLAYDEATGDLKWSAACGNHSYSSPQLATVAGKECVLIVTNLGLTFVAPEDGRVLGNYEIEFEGYRVVQPLVFDESNVLVGTPMGTGTECVSVTWDGNQFNTEPRWTSRGMKPYYNDFVDQGGFLYGFDDNIFACIDLEDGSKKWKRGRYGYGQVLSLPSGNQLLITCENGELVLLDANPKKLTELAKFQVLTGRTWNHPVMIGSRLYVRNGEEAACFELKLKSPTDGESSGGDNLSVAPRPLPTDTSDGEPVIATTKS